MVFQSRGLLSRQFRSGNYSGPPLAPSSRHFGMTVIFYYRHFERWPWRGKRSRLADRHPLRRGSPRRRSRESPRAGRGQADRPQEPGSVAEGAGSTRERLRDDHARRTGDRQRDWLARRHRSRALLLLSRRVRESENFTGRQGAGET